MDNSNTDIIEQFLNNGTLDNISEGQVRSFVARYPYMAAGRYLLALKMQQDSESITEEHRTAALYINNPLWLQWILNKGSVNGKGKTGEKDKENLSNEDHPEKSESSSSSGLKNLEPVEELSPEISADPKMAFTELPERKIEAANIQPTQVIVEPVEELSPDIPAIPNHEFREILGTDLEISESKPASENFDAEETDSSEAAPLPFQSYHTIDYFASQGIKLQQADLSRDKLGQQLKSFTEWLRSMKKLPAAEAADSRQDISESEPGDESVTRIAEHSIIEKEVVTETMAEVWSKQGNMDKARSIYLKLSLHNPEKSAYFAAKIDQLKVL